jgi:hypothetical protein
MLEEFLGREVAAIVHILFGEQDIDIGVFDP